jgi:hypothetical protein
MGIDCLFRQPLNSSEPPLIDVDQVSCDLTGSAGDISKPGSTSRPETTNLQAHMWYK